MPSSWSRSNTESLITMFQQHECLWNIRNVAYQDRVKREEAFHAITIAIKENFGGLTIADTKQKILSIRSQYRKELREINASKRSGAGAHEVRIPRLWCFHLLDFLRPSVEIRPTTSNIDLTTNEEYSYDVQDSTDDSHSAPSTPIQAQQRQAKKSRKDSAAQKEFADLMTVLENKTERKYEWLGEQIVSTLNHMTNEDVVDETILALQRLIMEFKIKDRTSTEQREQQTVLRHNTSSNILAEALEGIFDDDDL